MKSRNILNNTKTFEIISKYFSRYGETSAHVVRECARSSHVAVGLAKDSPYLPAVNAAIARLSEGGMVIKWTRDHMEQAGRLSTQ